ncbi:hypothetical protein Golax_004611, partial [Gossypium laxum]|nr:hypothetical protein [Gossypium laxum]
HIHLTGNLETLLQEKDIQADLLRFETKDKVTRHLSNVSFLLKPGGYFFGITHNLSTIWYEKVIGKYRCFWICVFSLFFILVTVAPVELKVEAASREAEVQRKYEELQLQLKVEAAAREAEQSRKYDTLQLQLQNMMKMFQQSQNPPS